MLYSWLRGFGRLVFYILGLKVEGLTNIPPTGPVIIAANHVSNWDPVVIALAIERPIHFMGKSELFTSKILGTFFFKLNAFPVRKDIPDRQAIKKALQILAEGQVLGIFPEGRRNLKGDLKAEPGVALLALKSGAPIVPVGCIGTNHRLPWGWSQPLLVRVGEPFYLTNSDDKKSKSATMVQLTADIMRKINSLLYK